jgi:hypothetical protein
LTAATKLENLQPAAERRRPYLELITPRDPHDPASAPLFDGVARTIVAPRVVGCLATAKRCVCYSQQATPLSIPEDQCRQRAAGAWFDPYAETDQQEKGYESKKSDGAGVTVTSNTVTKSHG